jgi:predicted N-acetyltransferase YhbS
MKIHIAYLADCDAHLATVAAWQQAEFGYLNPSLTLAQRCERLRGCLQKEALPMAFVALDDAGRPVGAASLFAQTVTHAHLTPWLSTVVVPPHSRGRGIASALSLRVADEAVRLGFKTVHLFTPHNESLYARLGWQTFERSHFQGVPITLMARAAREVDPPPR